MLNKDLKFVLFVILIILQAYACYDDELENSGVFASKKHSLLRPFHGNTISIPHWNFYGSTIVMSDYIRITPDKPGRKGGLWNTIPLESPFWEIHVSFKIHGSSKTFSGDGMAFWYTTTPIVEGDAFGAKAKFSGLSVMLDTYGNSLHKHTYPYISAMINNGSMTYDHDKDGTGVSFAGCEVSKIRNLDSFYTSNNINNGQETVLLIRYDREELIVKTNLDGTNQWTDCLTISGVKLPTHGYLGISASTGDLSDNHDVIWMKVHELEDDIEDDEELLGADGRRIISSDPYAMNKHLFAERKKIAKEKIKLDRKKIIPEVVGNLYSDMLVGGDNLKDKSSNGRLSSFSIFIIIFFTMLAFVFLAAVGYLYYQNQQERNRKRFY